MDDRNHGKVGAPFGNQNRAGKRKKFGGKGRKKKEAFNLRKSEYLAKRRREALKSTDLTINTNVAAANPTPLNLQLESPVRQPMFEGQPHERQPVEPMEPKSTSNQEPESQPDVPCAGSLTRAGPTGSTEVCFGCKYGPAQIKSRRKKKGLTFRRRYISADGADGHWRCSGCMRGYTGDLYTVSGELSAVSSRAERNTCACSPWAIKCHCEEYDGSPPYPDCTLGSLVDFKGGKSGAYLGAVRKGSTVHAPRKSTETFRFQTSRYNYRGTFKAPQDGVLLQLDGKKVRDYGEYVPVAELEQCVDRERHPPARWEPTLDEPTRRTNWARHVKELKTKRKPISQDLRRQVLEKDSNCSCCDFDLVLTKADVLDMRLSEGAFVTVMEAGHVWAQSLKGPDVLENLIPLCAVPCIDEGGGVVLQSAL